MKLRHLLLAAVASLSVMSVASAADLPQAPEAPEPVDIGGGWYLRGDIGVRVYDEEFDAAYKDRADKHVKIEYEDKDVDTAFFIGGGIGYKMNKWFRFDVTADHQFDADIEGRMICGGCATTAYSTEKTSFSVTTVMANGYIDLGHFFGFSPYIGAGVGGAYVDFDKHYGYNPDGSTNTLYGDSDWNFAWAVMGGTAFDLGNGLVADLGYRYLNIGEGESSHNDYTGYIEHDTIDSHEVRLGLRFAVFD